jgi:predicted ATPase
MITRVKVEGYKSLGSLEVRPRPLTVLFGPNAVGKSNFLDALQLLSRLVTSRTLKEAFEPPYRGTPLESFAFGKDGLAGHMQRESVRFQMEVDVTLSDATVATVERQIADLKKGSAGGEVKSGSYIKERQLRYRLQVEVLPRSGILRVQDEYLAALKGRGEVKASRNPFLERKDHRLFLRLEGQAHPTYHEVGLDHTIVSRPLYPPHYPHLVAFRQELAGWFCFYFEPRERMRAANPVKEVRHIGLMGEELASFLNTLQTLEPAQFRGVEKSLHTLIPRVQSIRVNPNMVGEVELQLVEDGVAVPARLVSEGTLRMLGLLALGGAKEAPTLVAFEEPENGIHPRRIELIARFLDARTDDGQTQFIVTTHSPILADRVPQESLFVCRREGGQTRIEPFVNEEGELFRAARISEGLSDPGEGEPPVSEKILRGDFDA